MGGEERWFTRRSWLGGLIAASAEIARAQIPIIQNEQDPFARLRPGHPRLMLLDGELERLKSVIRDVPLAKRLFGDLEKEAERLQTALPIEYKLAGPRLTPASRRTVDRIGTLALLFRLTGKDSYLHRAVMELRAGAGFKDWNPGHFLDVAEMTNAFAIGYDWLYPALSFEERGWISNAIVTKGLDPALSGYISKASWTASRYYWNPVCNSAAALGSLAVAEDFAPKSGAILKASIESLQRATPTWNTDGGWPEGPYFGELAAQAMATFCSSMDTCFGYDNALTASIHGFDRIGRFHFYTTSPALKSFNFGDASEDGVSSPEMQWLARRFNTPAYAWQEQKVLDRGARADFYDLVWFARDARQPHGPQWPLDAVFRGINAATFRSSWEDPNALFVAVKGGDNRPPHAHLDLGTFVLDAGGVRFAEDLGPDDFAPGPPPGRNRSGFYRVRTEAHNTLLIDGENQDSNGEARIVRQEFGPDLSWVQIDLSKANGTKTRLWQRRIGMAQRQAVIIDDLVESDRPIDVVWGMLTDANVTVNGQSALLQKGKWSLAAEIRSPRHAVFDIAPVRMQAEQGPNRKLIVRLGERITDLHLSVTLTPYRTGAVKPKITAQIPV